MKTTLFLFFFLYGVLTCLAHPHQYVEVELDYKFTAEELSEVAVVWGLGVSDSINMYDVYDTNTDGVLSASELNAIKLDSSKTRAQIRAFADFSLDGKKMAIPDDLDFEVFVEENRLFYSFRLPCHLPISEAVTKFRISYYDKTYFTEIVLSDQLLKFEDAAAFNVSAVVNTDESIGLLDGSVHPYYVELSLSRTKSAEKGDVKVHQEKKSSFEQWRKDFEKELMDKFLAVKHKFQESNSLKWYFILAGIAFLYGLLHAAGPGHGKAVVSSYLLSGNYRLRVGIMLSFLIAWLHAVSGVVLVVVLRFFLSLTIQGGTQSVFRWTTVISFSLVLCFGLYLLFRVIQEWRGREAVSREERLLEENPRAPFKVAILLGFVPCPAVVTVMTFALAMNAPGLGVVMVAAQTIGMGLTIAVLSSCIIGSKHLLSKTNLSWASKVEGCIEFLAAICVILFAGVFLLSALRQVGIF